MKPLVVIPTYNEKDNIEALLIAILKIVPDIHILIVDDNSPDGTGQIVESFIQEGKNGRGNIFCLHRSGKNGLGTAYIEGFNWGLKRGYDVFISMDADFSHNPIYLSDMLRLIQKHDCVIGSRYVRGGGIKNWGVIRHLISLGGSLYARIVLMVGVHDLTGGFNCYRGENLKKIKLDTILSKGYCFQIEMKFRQLLLGLHIHEIPIIFTDRAEGVSKMSGDIFKEAVLNVLKLTFSRRRLKRIMKG